MNKTGRDSPESDKKSSMQSPHFLSKNETSPPRSNEEKEKSKEEEKLDEQSREEGSAITD